MSTSTDQLRQKLHQEILDIPESRLQEIYDVIHFFRLGLRQSGSQEQHTTKPDVMRFAGAWEDMPNFEGFENELKERRQNAFTSRRSDETGPD